MSRAWKSFDDEISRWRDLGRSVDFWWRDDDAARHALELSRLLDLATACAIPLALAVVPVGADRGLLKGATPEISALQHGVDHINRAGPDEKKTEFPSHEPVENALQRLAGGLGQLTLAAGTRAVPVLAPPWNRLHPALIPELANAGYRGLSTFGPRAKARPAPGLSQVNTHVDIIDWKGGRGFAGVDQVLGQAIGHLEARRAGRVDAQEPTGWLTHHAVHDEAAWSFLERLFDVTRGVAGVRWLKVDALFDLECEQ